jgi:hypothetical protein
LGARYPDAKILCPPAAKSRVGARVRVDGDLGMIPPDPGLTVQTLAGSRIQEAALVVHSGSNARTTLVFNDTLMNLSKMPGIKGWVYGAIGSVGAPKVTALMKLYSVNDKAALREHLARLAELPGLVRAIPAHGAVIEGEGTPEVMRGVAAAV